MVSKGTICLWYHGTALETARLRSRASPDNAVESILRPPGDYPAGKQRHGLTVESPVIGMPCLAFNGIR